MGNSNGQSVWTNQPAGAPESSLLRLFARIFAACETNPLEDVCGRWRSFCLRVDLFWVAGLRTQIRAGMITLAQMLAQMQRKFADAITKSERASPFAPLGSISRRR